MQLRLVITLSLTIHQGVDFDWDLSDKTDTETQTRRGSQTGPADAIVQTDQRIVFQKANGEKRAVRFSSSAERGHRQTTSSSQTRWETRDKEVQVLPRDLDSGEGDEWTDWRGQATGVGTQVRQMPQLTHFHCVKR